MDLCVVIWVLRFSNFVIFCRMNKILLCLICPIYSSSITMPNFFFSYYAHYFHHFFMHCIRTLHICSYREIRSRNGVCNSEMGVLLCSPLRAESEAKTKGLVIRMLSFYIDIFGFNHISLHCAMPYTGNVLIMFTHSSVTSLKNKTIIQSNVDVDEALMHCLYYRIYVLELHVCHDPKTYEELNTKDLPLPKFGTQNKTRLPSVMKDPYIPL